MSTDQWTEMLRQIDCTLPLATRPMPYGSMGSVCGLSFYNSPHIHRLVKEYYETILLAQYIARDQSASISHFAADTSDTRLLFVD